MNTPTPRTDAAWNATFDCEQMSAGRTARALRECSQQLETELATLRAELEKVYALVTPVGFDLPGGIFETAQAVTELRAERDQLRVDLELADVMYQRECEVEHELRTEVERLRSDRDCEKRLRKDSDEFMENAIERATKAEADLVALEQCHDDNCRGVVKIADELATERARLDSGQILLTVSGERVWHCGVDLRAAIDAGMREGAK